MQSGEWKDQGGLKRRIILRNDDGSELLLKPTTFIDEMRKEAADKIPNEKIKEVLEEKLNKREKAILESKELSEEEKKEQVALLNDKEYQNLQTKRIYLGLVNVEAEKMSLEKFDEQINEIKKVFEKVFKACQVKE